MLPPSPTSLSTDSSDTTGGTGEGRNYEEKTPEHPCYSLSFGIFHVWNSFAFIKPNGIKSLVVTSLRLTQGRTLQEGREESKLCFPANTSGDLHVAGGVGQGSIQE